MEKDILLNDKNLIAKEYFKSNQIIISKFFEQQYIMFELLNNNTMETDKAKLISDLMELYKNIVLSAINTQKCGASYLLKEKQNIKYDEPAIPRVSNNYIEANNEIKESEHENVQLSNLVLEKQLEDLDKKEGNINTGIMKDCENTVLDIDSEESATNISETPIEEITHYIGLGNTRCEGLPELDCDSEMIFFPDVNPNYKGNNIENIVPEKICERIVGKNETDTCPIAVLRLFSDPTNIEENRILGFNINRGRHSFLSIENVSDTSIPVGKFMLAPGKTISLGTFSSGKTKEHSGLWYGLEARNISVQNIYGPRASIRCDITRYNLDTLNNNLPQFFNGWSYIKNCAYFATTIWNSICSVKITGKTPLTAKSVYDSIIKTGMYSFGVPVPYQFMAYHADASKRPVKSVQWS